MSITQHLKRIIRNLLYLLGKWISEKSIHLNNLQELIQNFIDGWLDNTGINEYVFSTDDLYI
jgi:hypothetical protein